MHIYLSEFTHKLHGCDTNGIEELNKHLKEGVFFKSISEADNYYNIILAPNILEHLVNPGLMVDALFEIKFEKMFVLVPNYKVYEQATYENGIFTEKIHPDHFCWYSPYTLYNLFKAQIEAGKYDFEMNFFDNRNMVSILIKKL